MILGIFSITIFTRKPYPKSFPSPRLSPVISE